MNRQRNFVFHKSWSCICFDGVVFAAQCTATFSRSIVLPEYRYKDVNMPIKVCSEAYFSGLRFLKEPEISDSGSPAYKVPPGDLVLRIFMS